MSELTVDDRERLKGIATAIERCGKSDGDLGISASETSAFLRHLASVSPDDEPIGEDYALAVYVYEQILKTGAGEATAVMAAIDHVRKPIRSQEHQRVREALERLDRYVIGTGSSGGHYREHTVGQMILMNEKNARGEKGQWIRRADALAALDTLEDPEQPALSEGVGSGAGGGPSEASGGSLARFTDTAPNCAASAAPSVQSRCIFCGRRRATQVDWDLNGELSDEEAQARGLDDLCWEEEDNSCIALLAESDRPTTLKEALELLAAPPAQAVQGERRCGGVRLLHATVPGQPHTPCPGCPDCQPEKGGEGMKHELKCWPPYFEHVLEGRKTFEARSIADRHFSVGDSLFLREYDGSLGHRHPETSGYTGRTCERRVSYVLGNGDFGIKEGFVVLALREETP